MEIRDKKYIRLKYNDLRTELSNKEINKLSLQIASNLISNFKLSAKSIHIFLPIKNKKEVNTWHIMDLLFKKNNTVCTSVYESNEELISHVKINKETKYIDGDYDIPLPELKIPIDIKNIDCIIIPLLAYDIKGNRIGYGKGIYDKILNQLSERSIKIGLSFFEPENVMLPIEEHDIPLNFCQTPNQLYSFI